jgi:hypothetical protein
MKIRALLAAFFVVCFSAASFAGADPGLPGKNAPAAAPTTVQANAPADTGAVTQDGDKPHKKHHRKSKHHKKHTKHTKKNPETTNATNAN